MLVDILQPPSKELIDEKISKLSPVRQIITSINYFFNSDKSNIKKLSDLNIENGTYFLSTIIHNIRVKLNLNVHYKIDFSEHNFSYLIKIYTKFGWNSNKHIDPEEETIVIFIWKKWENNL